MTKAEMKNSVWAGLIAGVVFMILEMIMMPIFGGGSPWGPPRMIAAIALGPEALPPPATFNLGIFLVALVVHFILSIIYAFILTAMIRRMNVGMGILFGAVFGLVLYLINFYAFTAVFPWFAEARNWITITVHIVFGVVTVWAFKGITEPEEQKVVYG